MSDPTVRKPSDGLLTEAQRLLRTNVLKAIEVASVCLADDSAAIRLKAAEFICDRVLGKPAQPLVGDNDADPINIKEIVIRAVGASDDRPT